MANYIHLLFAPYGLILLTISYISENYESLYQTYQRKYRPVREAYMSLIYGGERKLSTQFPVAASVLYTAGHGFLGLALLTPLLLVSGLVMFVFSEPLAYISSVGGFLLAIVSALITQPERLLFVIVGGYLLASVGVSIEEYHVSSPSISYQALVTTCVVAISSGPLLFIEGLIQLPVPKVVTANIWVFPLVGLLVGNNLASRSKAISGGYNRVKKFLSASQLVGFAGIAVTLSGGLNIGITLMGAAASALAVQSSVLLVAMTVYDPETTAKNGYSLPGVDIESTVVFEPEVTPTTEQSGRGPSSDEGVTRESSSRSGPFTNTETATEAEGNLLDVGGEDANDGDAEQEGEIILDIDDANEVTVDGQLETPSGNQEAGSNIPESGIHSPVDSQSDFYDSGFSN